MHIYRKLLWILILFICGCAMKVSVKVPLEKLTPALPVPANPYLQMKRALESFQLDANIRLNHGLFTIPQLPVAGDVNIEIPEGFDLHVILDIVLEKSYQQDAEKLVKNLTAIKPVIKRAVIAPNKAIPVRAGAIGFDFIRLEYEGQVLTTELALKMDLISFFISPATGIPVDEVNEEVMMSMLQEVEINSLRGNFTPHEILSLQGMELALSEGSLVELNGVLFHDQEHVSGTLSLNLDLDYFLMGSGEFNLKGNESSRLELRDLRFAYNEGTFSIEGREDPFQLSFAGSFSSGVGQAVIDSPSGLVLKKFSAAYRPDAPAEISAAVATRWTISQGSLDLGDVKLTLENTVFELAEATWNKTADKNLLSVDSVNLDASLSAQLKDPGQILELINSRVQDDLKDPVTYFKALMVYLPGQNYRIEGLSLELEDWQKINRASGLFQLKVKAGPILDFETGLDLAGGIVMASSLEVGELRVPLSFNYDGEQTELTGETGFQAGATLRITKPFVIYRDLLGSQLTKVPKQLADINKTSFSVSILPSVLSVKAQAMISWTEHGYILKLQKLGFSGNLSTQFDAGRVARLTVEVPFGAGASYTVSASKKLLLGKSIGFTDKVALEAGILTAPFLALQELQIPVGEPF